MELQSPAGKCNTPAPCHHHRHQRNRPRRPLNLPSAYGEEFSPTCDDFCAWKESQPVLINESWGLDLDLTLLFSLLYTYTFQRISKRRKAAIFFNILHCCNNIIIQSFCLPTNLRCVSIPP